MADVAVIADAFGAASYPYTIAIDTAADGVAELIWPAGTWIIESGANVQFSVGANAQMLDGQRQRAGLSGISATLSTTMDWTGAEATTMRSWLRSAAGTPWIVQDGYLLGYSGPIHGRFTKTVEVQVMVGSVRADIEAVIWWP